MTCRFVSLIAFFIILLSEHSCFADMESRFRKIENKTSGHQLRNIDFIYLINLDKRVDRLEACMKELAPYGINPFRFSAVYGRALSVEAYNDVGVHFRPGMKGDMWALRFNKGGQGQPEYDFLRPACHGHTFFSRWMSHGAVGVALSNLSILQDAYDAGYQTIWVLEDDFLVVQNPHLLSSLIEKLDQAVGRDNWDILFTDIDEAGDRNLQGRMWYLERPDNGLLDLSIFSKRSRLDENFIKVGCRSGLYSAIIRRSGMKKILEYEKQHGEILSKVVFRFDESTQL